MTSKLNAARIIIHIILIIGAVAMVFPFLWMVLTSLKTMEESTRVPIVFFPQQPIWANYSGVLQLLPFFEFFMNTIVVAAAKIIGQLAFCSLAAYAFAKIDFPGKHVLFVLSLAVLMVPGQVYMLPQFLIMRDLHWLNTLKALIVPGLFSAFGMFMLRQFFMSLPNELAEAAKIDGCNQFKIYWRIMLPLTVPGLMAVAIFTMLASWNDLMWPLIVNSSPDKMTLAVGLSLLQGQFTTNFPVLMAGSVMATIPMLIIFIFFQRYFVEGISMTGSK
ncbi:carbohydrate ABC transporter permease [Paenibacillus campi]|uniref:carbohydrate ABC transporter permease n=1 Tax=Paenibacillus campi TaxID=3106031 RepID=UPI002AFEE82B|nr:carbohydrate ABC transporter permease [Paenibacillus sp. SGZ-1014]